MEQLDIKSLYEDELKEKMVSLGEKPFKGKQLYQWLHQKAVGSYEEMTNLSESLRQKLTKQEPLTHLEVVEVQTSKIDGTQKYLFQSGGRQRDRECVDEIQTRQFRMYFFPGRLPDGMPFLCIHDRRIDQKPPAVRDARSGLPDPGDDRRTGVQRRCDGNGRTAG